MKSRSLRFKHLLLAFSIPFVLYAILGGFLGRALARDSAYRYLSVFQDVVTLVMNNYLNAPEMVQVMDGAIRGMLEALDPDSCYLNAEEYLAFKDPEAHKKADIGVELTKRYYLRGVRVLPPRNRYRREARGRDAQGAGRFEARRRRPQQLRTSRGRGRQGGGAVRFR